MIKAITTLVALAISQTPVTPLYAAANVSPSDYMSTKFPTLTHIAEQGTGEKTNQVIGGKDIAGNNKKRQIEKTSRKNPRVLQAQLLFVTGLLLLHVFFQQNILPSRR